MVDVPGINPPSPRQLAPFLRPAEALASARLLPPPAVQRRQLGRHAEPVTRTAGVNKNTKNETYLSSFIISVFHP